MFSRDRTLPPVLHAILVAGAPAKGSNARGVVAKELRDFVYRGRKGLTLLERDLDADDIESAVEMLRTMHRGHDERLKRIQAATGKMPAAARWVDRCIRCAPYVTAGSILVLVAIDLADMGGWHHGLWIIPFVSAVSVPLMRRLAP